MRIVTSGPRCRVVFVCTGNICRSPIAEKVLTEHLRRAGLDGLVEVSSVGTSDWHVGEPADPRAAEVLARHGYPTEHAAAQLAVEHADADLLVALDSGHARALHRMVRDPDRVRLLRSFDPATDARRRGARSVLRRRRRLHLRPGHDQGRDARDGRVGAREPLSGACGANR
jgi:protein-tyrosine phosphatase